MPFLISPISNLFLFIGVCTGCLTTDYGLSKGCVHAVMHLIYKLLYKQVCLSEALLAVV